MPRASIPAVSWVTASDIARHYGVSNFTVRRWIHSGKLPAFQVQSPHYTDDRPRKTKRGEWRVRVADLDAFIARMRSA